MNNHVDEEPINADGKAFNGNWRAVGVAVLFSVLIFIGLVVAGINAAL